VLWQLGICLAGYEVILLLEPPANVSERFHHRPVWFRAEEHRNIAESNLIEVVRVVMRVKEPFHLWSAGQERLLQDGL